MPVAMRIDTLGSASGCASTHHPQRTQGMTGAQPKSDEARQCLSH
jgi:hypothetical protein